jgi:type VI secretion system protein ImpE
MNAKEHYQAGRLAEAIAAATDHVKQHPTDASQRGFLCELLCFAGQWQRADLQLDAIGQQDPQSLMGLSMFRQLIRAEQARQQFYSEGRLPEFLDQPSGCLKCHLEASIRIREGKPREAVELLEGAEELRPGISGVCDGQAFDELRDLDDLTAPFFEVLTSNGKYYWIPMERVSLIEFHAPVRARDLLWRRVHMVVADGPDGEVFLPALYAGSCEDPDDRVKLGRFTDWRGTEGTPTRGIGQRTFLVGEADRPILELKEITFNAASASDGNG